MVFSQLPGVSLKVFAYSCFATKSKSALASNPDLDEYGCLTYNYEKIHLHPGKRRFALGL
jgi:hypothetical protein